MRSKDSVGLKDLLDVDFLQDFQDNFAGSVGVASLTEDEDGNALTRPSCFSELCIKIIRTTECGLRRCQQLPVLICQSTNSLAIMRLCLNLHLSILQLRYRL